MRRAEIRSDPVGGLGDGVRAGEGGPIYKFQSGAALGEALADGGGEARDEVAGGWGGDRRLRLAADENMGNLCCCVQVDQSTVAIKEKFGKFNEVLEPGCHCLPWFLGSQLSGHLSVRLQ